MIGIYKITNLINNKSYIGQSIHIERRWQEHQRPSSSSMISKAIKKYGVNNFSFEIIEEVKLQDIDKLDELEKKYIHQYNTITPNGYNVTDYTGVQHTHFIYYDKDEFKDIINLIKNTNLTFEVIAEKYGLNKRTISRINNGQVHKMINEKYPLRDTTLPERQHYYCIDCGKEISIKCTRCDNCSRIFSRKVERPLRKDLKNMIRSKSFVSIGKDFGVSDNAVRKWCDYYNLPRKKGEIKSYSDEEWEKI